MTYDIQSVISAASDPAPDHTPTPRTRTVIHVMLDPSVDGNASVIACAVAAVEGLPFVSDVRVLKVRAKSPARPPRRSVDRDGTSSPDMAA